MYSTISSNNSVELEAVKELSDQASIFIYLKIFTL